VAPRPWALVEITCCCCAFARSRSPTAVLARRSSPLAAVLSSELRAADQLPLTLTLITYYRLPPPMPRAPVPRAGHAASRSPSNGNPVAGGGRRTFLNGTYYAHPAPKAKSYNLKATQWLSAAATALPLAAVQGPRRARAKPWPQPSYLRLLTLVRSQTLQTCSPPTPVLCQHLPLRNYPHPRTCRVCLFVAKLAIQHNCFVLHRVFLLSSTTRCATARPRRGPRTAGVSLVPLLGIAVVYKQSPASVEKSRLCNFIIRASAAEPVAAQPVLCQRCRAVSSCSAGR
jgi:hypothetical protein